MYLYCNYNIFLSHLYFIIKVIILEITFYISLIFNISYCRPPFRHGSLFLYLFLQITFSAKCHYPGGPRVTSLVTIRNQPRFLKLQKEWDRKGGGRKGGRKRWLQKECGRKKDGCSRDRWEANPESLGGFGRKERRVQLGKMRGKSEIQRRGRKKEERSLA